MSRTSFITEILKQDDRSQLEIFAEFQESEILKTVCAFLNSNGGWIIIGLVGSKAVGILGDCGKLASDLEDVISNQILPQPLVYTKCEIYQQQNIILVNVMKGPRQPYTYEGSYFIRDKHRSKTANRDDISILLRSATETASTWEKLTAIDAEFQDLDALEIQRTIFTAKEKGRAEQLPEEMKDFLSYFQLYDFNAVKNGAIMLFGNNPNRFLPQARIRITVMPDGRTGDEYLDTKLFESNLFTGFDQLQSYFKSNLPMISSFKSQDWNRIDRYKYPLDALDEALVNAIVHRDYGDFAGEITINIFSDRMEIINSGEIPSDIIRGKNSIKTHHSILRNPTIAHMFYLRGKMEKLGRGLNLIINRFTEYGLRKPEWTTLNGYTTLTLFSVPAEIVFNKRMIQYLESIRTDQIFTRETYQAFFEIKISDKTATTDLTKLTLANLLRKVNDGPATRYIRTDKELPEITGS